ncbi:MAG: hypothetical protein KDK40_00295, partial [Chlamydiia bacterium]|nr:hypothetical protein [Chlamydiia bacterium]
YMKCCEKTPLEISSEQLFNQQNYYIQSLVEQCQKLALIAHNRGEKILFSRTLLLHGKITAELIKHAQLARLTLKYLPQLSHLGLQSGWKGSVEKIQLMLVHLIRELMNRGSGETLPLFTEIVECMREIARIQHRNDRDQPVVFIKEPFLMILEAIERSSNIDGSTLKTYREPVEDALSELNHLEMILDKIPEFPGSPAADTEESIDETAAEEETQP